ASRDGGCVWFRWSAIPAGLLYSLTGRNRWLERLTRKEISHLVRIDEERFACFAYSRAFLISSNGDRIEDIGPVEGGRPLSVVTDGERIIYGVYKWTEKREPVRIWAYHLADRIWKPLYTFKGVRHIHGVYSDPYQPHLWVTTGDLDEESMIFCFERGQASPVRVAGGSQQTRTVELLFTEDALFYATDAPDETNFIYRLDRDTHAFEPVQQVGGPVYWGWQAGSTLFFSTVAEPSKVNRSDAVELWGSVDEGRTWRCLAELEKDFGHMYLFQYGKLKFPSGQGDGRNLWFTPRATKWDRKIVRIPFSEIE
ncbi:MAG: hypothetical protein WD709_03780, partial [Gammaproteobacteria bacterium]